MSPFKTLRARLVAGSLVVNAVLLLAVGAGLWLTVRTIQAQEVDRTLQLSAAQLAAAVDVRDGEVVVPGDDAAAATVQGVFGWVLDADGGVRVKIGAAPAQVPAPHPALGAWLDGRLGDGTPVRFYARGLSADNGGRATGLTLLVGLSREPSERTATTILLILGVAIPLALAAAAGAAWLVAGRAVAPLGAIAAQAQRIDRENLAERVTLRDPPAEVGVLAATFNAMLDRLATAFAHERRFTADAAHELRTPLSLVKTQIGLALNRPRSAETLTTMLQALETDVDRLTRLVERLLLLARLDTPPAATGPPPTPVDLAVLLAGLVDQWQALAGAGGVTVIWEGRGAAWVPGDADHLVQLFLNLLDNAVAWTPPGGQVTVRLTAAEGGWQVAIQDTGPGIAAEHLAHLFERFYRVDPARARATGGTGLGLAIAQAIAGEHGGRISVASRVSGGSTFTVWLPRPAGAAPPVGWSAAHATRAASGERVAPGRARKDGK